MSPRVMLAGGVKKGGKGKGIGSRQLDPTGPDLDDSQISVLLPVFFPFVACTEHGIRNMAAQQSANAVMETVGSVTEQVSQLTMGESAEGQPKPLLDEVTGEMVSKSELKKRQKQREKDAKKAEREATRQPPPQSKRKAGAEKDDEAELNPNVSHTSLLLQHEIRPRKLSPLTCPSNTSRSVRAPSSA